MSCSCHACACGHVETQSLADSLWESVKSFQGLSLWISSFLLITGLIFEEWLEESLGLWLMQWLFFAIPYGLCGWPVLYEGFKGLCQKDFFNEFTLMGGATIAAMLLGEWPEAVGVMLFYRLGEAVSERAAGNTRTAIKSLLAARPRVAHQVQGEQIIDVLPESLAPGMIIMVRPGEQIPLDGVVLQGNSFVDMSPLNGEPKPARLDIGSAVYAGTINLEGALTVEVSAHYKDSSVAKILNLVEEATANKSPTERFITRLARYYTPAVALGAVLVAIVPPIFGFGTFSEWLYKALVLLVISCPCALVISIPLGYFGGIGAASRQGILIKGSYVLDALHHIKSIAMDKTGTLTQGVFNVTKIMPVSDFSESELLSYAALAEAHSNHPIARSIISYTESYHNFKKLEYKQVQYKEYPGMGIAVMADNTEILLGQEEFLRQHNIIIPTSSLEIGSLVHVAVGGKYSGLIVVSDILRDSTEQTIKELQDKGYKITILTGDRRENADLLAKKLKVNYEANLLPEDKAQALARLAAIEPVLFMGDGLNDAPVLALARVGVAMGGLGAQAAIEVADAVILDDSPAKLPKLLKIAAKTRIIIWENIIFALGVKIMFIILGIVGLSGLWEAVFADVGVALLAILNSTRAMRDV